MIITGRLCHDFRPSLKKMEIDVIYASSLITRTVWLCRQFGPRFLYSYVMYLMRSCDQYLTNHIVTENLNDYKRYNKGVEGKCQLLSFPIFLEGIICIRDVEK